MSENIPDPFPVHFARQDKERLVVYTHSIPRNGDLVKCPDDAFARHVTDVIHAIMDGPREGQLFDAIMVVLGEPDESIPLPDSSTMPASL